MFDVLMVADIAVRSTFLSLQVSTQTIYKYFLPTVPVAMAITVVGFFNRQVSAEHLLCELKT